MLLMFSKTTPKFSVNDNKSLKLYFEPQLLIQQQNISYKENFWLNFVSKQGFTSKHWWNEVDIEMLATQRVSRILSHSLKSHREPSD